MTPDPGRACWHVTRRGLPCSGSLTCLEERPSWAGVSGSRLGGLAGSVSTFSPAKVSQVEPGSIDPQLVSPANSSCVGEGNLFLYPLRFCPGDLSMKLMKDISIGATQLYSFLTVCAQPSQREGAKDGGLRELIRRRNRTKGGEKSHLQESKLILGTINGPSGE